MFRGDGGKLRMSYTAVAWPEEELSHSDFMPLHENNNFSNNGNNNTFYYTIHIAITSNDIIKC